jgi:hypothetical protein
MTHEGAVHRTLDRLHDGMQGHDELVGTMGRKGTISYLGRWDARAP